MSTCSSMCGCRVPRYAGSSAQAALPGGGGREGIKGHFSHKRMWGVPRAVTPPVPPHPPLQTPPQTHALPLQLPQGRISPHPTPAGMAGPPWAGPGRAPPALPPRRFRANFPRAGRRRPVPGSAWAGGTLGRRPPCPALPKGPSDTHPLPRALRGAERGSTAPPRAPAGPRAAPSKT